VWWLPRGETGNDGDSVPFRSRDLFDTGDEGFFRQICDDGPFGIAIVDTSTTVRYANERFAEILGRPMAEITGSTYADPDWNLYNRRGRAVTEEDHPVTRALVTAEPTVRFDLGIARPDGTECWVSGTVTLFEDDETGRVAVVGVMDLADRDTDVLSDQSQPDEMMRLYRVNTVLRGVALAISKARAREDVERAVCRLVARSEPYLFAVLGSFSNGYTEFTPRASSGIGDAYIREMLEDPAAPPIDDGPGATAARTGEIQVVQNITELPYEYWETAAETHRFHSYASVPLVHEGVVDGVLGVYAREPWAFDAEERELLTELGEMVGYALHAIDATAKLRREQELELTLRSESLTRRIRDQVDGPFRVNGDGSVELSDSTYLQYYTVNGMFPNVGMRLVKQLNTRDVRLLSTSGDRFTLEVHSSPESLGSQVASFGGEITGITFDERDVDLEVRLPRSTNRQEVIRSVREAYPDVELVSADLVFTPRTFRHVIETRLTDRQRTAIELAHRAGYFEQPRASTGSDLGERMGVTGTTFHRHLRNAERRIFRELFEIQWTDQLDRE
jgi:PAS domain S-box-containing protein